MDSHELGQALLVMAIMLAWHRWIHIIPLLYSRLHLWLFPHTTVTVLKYLERPFRDPKSLLQAMARGSFFLAGSRALEYFVPESTLDGDPWSFYTYCTPTCVGFAVRALEEQGVCWHDVFEPLRDFLHAPPRACAMHAEDLAAYAWHVSPDNSNRARTDQDVEQFLEVVSAILATSKACKRIIYGRRVVIVLRCQRESRLQPSTSIYAIRGHTTTNGTNQPVRLVFLPGRTPIEHVFAFLASPLQCVISGFSAFHCYYQLARHRSGFVWRNNSQPAASEAIEAITAGQKWNISEADMAAARPNIRRFGGRFGGSEQWNGRSKFVSFDELCVYSKEILDARRKALECVVWEESEGRTSFVRIEQPSLRAALAANTDKPLTRAYRTQLRGAEDLARKYSVAFRKGEKYPPIDGLSGV